MEWFFDHLDETKAAFNNEQIKLASKQKFESKVLNLLPEIGNDPKSINANTIGLITNRDSQDRDVKSIDKIIEERNTTNFKRGTRSEFKNFIQEYPNSNENLWTEDNLNILEHWRELYLQAAKNHDCMIYVFPYHKVLRETLRKLGRESIVYDEDQLRALKSESNSYSNPKPVPDPWLPMDGSFSPAIQHITSAVLNFTKTIHLGIHWRYNQDDWSKRCSVLWTKKGLRENPEECGLIDNLSFDKLAENILEIGESIGKSIEKQQTSINIYIAVPPTELSLTYKTLISKIEEKEKSSKSKFNFQFININFPPYSSLLKAYNQCNWFKNYQNDVISLTEQAIMSEVSQFYYFTNESSWSKRVIDRRVVLGREGNFPLMEILEKSQGT